MLQRLITSFTHRVLQMPVLVLMPHSRCNCRCVMCDIWKANHEKKELLTDDLIPHVKSFRKLGVKRIALSGGEALLHPNLWSLCKLLRDVNIKISLLSTGITLAQHAEDIVKNTDDVIVSLDGSPDVHDLIRNIPRAYEKLRAGVQALKSINPDFRVTTRTVLQKLNHHDFLRTIETGKALSVDQMSFLGADVSTEAFNRPHGWPKEKVSVIALNESEIEELNHQMNISFSRYEPEYRNQFIAENPKKMLQIVKYFEAILGTDKFPQKKCNAPWVSAVVESDGHVRPCFFHKSYGNLKDDNFENLLNSNEAIRFRKELDVSTNEICQRCVCSLYVPLTQSQF